MSKLERIFLGYIDVIEWPNRWEVVHFKAWVGINYAGIQAMKSRTFRIKRRLM